MKRHQLILEKLHANNYVDVLELCKEFDVSAVTIRKDLNLLEQKGLLFRTHGGASLDNPYINERHVNEKEKLFVNEKNKIAEVAAKRVVENDSIMIASGTTVQAFSKTLSSVNKLTAITASLNVAIELIKNKDFDVIQLGGYVRHSSSSVVGDFTSQVLEDVSCSKLFLGVDGIDLEHGLTTTDLEEAILNKKMIKAVQKVIVLADSSKFGKKSFGKICGLDQIHEIITDSKISSVTVNKLKEIGVTVTIAK
jgi:DeoR family transcriptional regulator of aga operon